MPLSALSPEELQELRIRLEAREAYEAASEEERQRIQYRAELEADFTAFVRAAWHVIRPGVDLKWSWHYDLLAEYLAEVYERKILRLRVNMPPRTLKSILVTVMFPVWVWTKQATHNFATASYSGDLSTEHSVLRRRLIESDWFKGLWGDRIWLAEDQNQKTKYQNNSQAQMLATSVGGSATGLGGDTLILDDAMKPEEAPSETVRKTAHDWFDGTWSTRLNDPSTGAMIVVEQRTHELDISGALTEEAGWTLLCLPLEAEENERWVFPKSGRVVERSIGEILQPDRFPPPVIESLKRTRLVWAGQYQQHPSPLEGNMIKRSEVRYYGGRDPVTGEKDRALPDKFDAIVLSVDCAFKDLKTSDYVCVGAIGAKGPDRFIFNVTLQHLDEPATKTEIRRQRTAYRATSVLIEDKANGPAVIKSMRREISGIVEIEPEGGKISRMFAVCGEWQAGNWYVDRTAAWTEPFITSICNFPTHKYDDDVDMMTQAASWLQRGSMHLGLVEYLKQEDERLKKGAHRYKDSIPPNQDQATIPAYQKPADEVAMTGVAVNMPDPNGTPPVERENVAKVDVPANVLRCKQCGSMLIQRIPNGKRCGNCGAQWGMNQPQPDSSQVRK